MRTKPATTMTSLLLGTALLFGVAACSDDSNDAAPATAPGGTTVSAADPSDLRHDVLVSLANDVMVPAYQRLADSTAALLSAVEAACTRPEDDAARTEAEQRWSAARGDWMATRAFRFGPATTLRTMSTIDFPIDPAKIDALVDGDGALTEQSLAALGADQRGLGGIEHVLFGAGPLDDQACSYLSSAAMLVAGAGAEVLSGWTEGVDGERPFAAQLAGPGQGGMYADEHEAYEDIVNSMIFAIADVADARIGRASGDVTGTPLPEEVDAGPAHRAKQDAIDVVAGVQALYDGAAPGMGLGAVVQSIAPETAAAMDDGLDAALDALDALPQPLAGSTDPEQAHAAYEALRAVTVVLRAEVASQLGVTLTFGDADGDS